MQRTLAIFGVVCALGLLAAARHGQVLNRSGNGEVSDADADTGWECGVADDRCSLYVNRAEDFRWTGNTMTVLSGSTLSVASGGALTVASGGTFGVVSQTIGIPFHDFRIYDNIDAILDQAAADDDDLTLVQGTLGTHATRLETIDCGGLADTPQKAMFWFVVPSSYVAGSTLSLRANAGMVTTVADQSATLDFSCYVPDYGNADGTVSSDLITTAAQSVNSLTFADKTFVVDDDVASHVLTAGSVVQCLLTALCDDDGNAGGGITVAINRLDLLVSE